MQSPLGPLGVVGADEFRENRGEVLLVEHDDVVEACSAERPDDPFGHGVGLWSADRRGDGGDTDALGSRPEVTAINSSAIAEQMARLVSPGRGLAQLAPHPGGCRIRQVLADDAATDPMVPSLRPPAVHVLSRLRDARVAACLTQQELADRAGVARETVALGS